MDYVMGELLRQRQLLARLFQGRRTETAEEAESQAGKTEGFAEEHFSGVESRRYEDASKETTPAAEMPVEAAGRRLAGVRNQAESLMADVRGGRGELRQDFRSGLAESGQRTQGWKDAPETDVEMWDIRYGGVLRQNAADREARELSRAFQRDARRYDGGFGPY